MTPNSAAMEFLLTRRSRPAKTLTGPVPTREELMPILTAAARTPDHGKLEPWRFVVLEGAALVRVAATAETRATEMGRSDDDIAKARKQFDDSQMCVAVISAVKDSPKIPEIEQVYSAGAVCLALVNAALASGWGANWLSGWISHDPQFGQDALGLEPHEKIAGFIHLGTETSTPPERPRPDLEKMVSWLNE